MGDFNEVLTPGNVEQGFINVVNEIPCGSNHKIEWDREKKLFKLDRDEPIVFAKPTNYGFIPQTLDEDGDELDVLLLTDKPLGTGVYLEAKIIGVMKFVDDGEVDDSLEDVPSQLIKQIEFHFNHYKDMKKPGTTKVESWGDIDEAKSVVKDAISRWNNR